MPSLTNAANDVPATIDWPTIACCQPIREALSLRGSQVSRIATSNEMRPKGHVGACNVSPGDVQPFVPVVERLIVRALEAGTADLERLHVIPGPGAHHLTGDVSRVGYVAGRG